MVLEKIVLQFRHFVTDFYKFLPVFVHNVAEVFSCLLLGRGTCTCVYDYVGNFVCSKKFGERPIIVIDH